MKNTESGTEWKNMDPYPEKINVELRETGGGEKAIISNSTVILRSRVLPSNDKALLVLPLPLDRERTSF